MLVLSNSPQSLTLGYLSSMSSPTNSNPVGLCANCVHARPVESAKGSQFLLCQLSQSDPRFPKYPRLPVLTCSGYQKARPSETKIQS